MADFIAEAPMLHVEAEVRYWEDADVNGVEDEDGQIPLRDGDLWKPIIDLRTGQVQGWPSGTTADIHYKVCDQGEYWLANKAGDRKFKWGGYYVPDKLLCVGDRGYGDYIIFKVGADGRIIGWTEPRLADDEDENGRWTKL